MRDEALAGRGMVRRAPAADGTPLDLLALPWRIDAERPPLRFPPPRLGEHTAEFMARFGS